MATEAVTITHPNVDSAFASGTITSDGTICYVSCGFQPSYIQVYNVTANLVYEWWLGMTAANYKLTTGSTGVISQVTSAGPIVFAGDDDEGEGFVIPDALLADADVVKWLAFR